MQKENSAEWNSGQFYQTLRTKQQKRHVVNPFICREVGNQEVQKRKSCLFVLGSKKTNTFGIGDWQAAARVKKELARDQHEESSRPRVQGKYETLSEGGLTLVQSGKEHQSFRHITSGKDFLQVNLRGMPKPSFGPGKPFVQVHMCF